MGADTSRSTDAAFQPRRFTTYERDQNGSDEAMSRRYNRAHARFDQPDPYDGSYSPSDPQSLNRYAYVQNDPVNFTDPTGLLPNCHSTFGWDPEGGVGYNGSLVATGTICYGVPDDWYNGPKEPNIPDPPDEPGGQGAEEPLPFNSCAGFVDFLVSLTQEFSKKVANKDSQAKWLGTAMMDLAFNGYGRHISNRAEGFKDELTVPGGQGAGVYGHVLGQGGAKLIGWQAMIVGGVFDAYDHAQKLYGTEQAPAEVAGNKAGWAVGDHIWNFLSGRTPREPDRLRNSLESELCK